MELQMGPSHPASHGTIKFNLRLDGETIVDVDVEIGYLHRGFEKMCEQGTWNHVFPYADRLNYASPLINNVGFALAVEKLAGLSVPERCQYIRVIAGEISRHHRSPDLPRHGCQRDRRDLGRLLHARGARIPLRSGRGDHRRAAHRQLLPPRRRDQGPAGRLGGADADRAASTSAAFSPTATSCSRATASSSIACPGSASWPRKTPSLTGSPARCCAPAGVSYDVRKAEPYLVYDRMDFEVPTGTHGRQLRPFHGALRRDGAEHAHRRAGARPDSLRPDASQTTRATSCRRSRKCTATSKA